MVTHTREKNFACTQCDWRGSRGTRCALLLRVHTPLYTPTDPYRLCVGHLARMLMLALFPFVNFAGARDVKVNKSMTTAQPTATKSTATAPREAFVLCACDSAGVRDVKVNDSSVHICVKTTNELLQNQLPNAPYCQASCPPADTHGRKATRVRAVRFPHSGSYKPCATHASALW
jgi:hypothetical protein